MAKIITYIKRTITLLELMTFALFWFLYPWVSKVNFMQNDDWNRTTSVLRFLSGDFSLLQVTATTFYAQGFLGYFFSLIFGYKNLPFLTLLVSVLNFYVFAKILVDHFNLSKFRASLISLVLFFTPLHIYSSIGFMTENYTMLFMLLSIYFVMQYENNRKIRSFVLFNLSGIISFFTKQNGIIVNFAYIPYLVYKKRYKEALIQSLVVGTLFAYYFLLFPKTQEMKSKGFIFENFSDHEYAYSLLYGILLVTVSFVLPFVFNFVLSTLFESKRKVLKIVFIVGSAVILYLFLNKNFIPKKISWGEYPYFENTFERTGFFPRGISGTKYHFKWNYDIYRYWDTASKILLALALPCLFFHSKKIINIFSLSILGYVVLMVFTQRFYDRYLLPLIPLVILFLIYLTSDNFKLRRLFFSVIFSFLVFTSIFSTQMGLDFIVTNNYVWGRSEDLVRDDVHPRRIKATMAWHRTYGERVEEPFFIFSFDSPDTVPEILDKYELFEEKDTGFEGSIFVQPRIYLYRMR